MYRLYPDGGFRPVGSATSATFGQSQLEGQHMERSRVKGYFLLMRYRACAVIGPAGREQ